MDKETIRHAETVISVNLMFEHPVDKEKIRDKVDLFSIVYELDEDSKNAVILGLFQRYGLFDKVKKERLSDILELSPETRQLLIDESFEE